MTHRTQPDRTVPACPGMNALANVVPFANPGALTEHDALDRFEDALVEAFPGLDPDSLVTHRFGGGIYVREMFIPAGMIVTSLYHEVESVATCSQGAIWVWTAGSGEGFKLIEAPFTAVTEAGTRRVGIAERDTVWTTYHITDKTDIDEIAKELFCSETLARRERLRQRTEELARLRGEVPRMVRAMAEGGLSKCLGGL